MVRVGIPNKYNSNNIMDQIRNTIRIGSYNCRGLPKSAQNLLLRPDVASVLGNNDIICLQETWLARQDLHCINTISSNVHGIGVSTTDLRDGLLSGHPPGGVAVLWHTKWENNIKPLDFNLDWCVGIEITTDSRSIILICVYLPYQRADNEENYLNCLGALSAVIDDLGTSSYIILGDWNSNLANVQNSLFARHMIDFCNENNLHISSQLLLPQSSYSYISSPWGTVSWLDHVVSSTDSHNAILDMSIDYDTSDEDHIPLSLSLSLENLPEMGASVQADSPKVQWDRLSEQEIQQYRTMTDRLLSELSVPVALQCTDLHCTSDEHHDSARALYEGILVCLRQASRHVLSAHNRRGNLCRPGWADHVADLYQVSREAYKRWLCNGKPRQGLIFHDYLRLKAKCKYAIRFIKRHENGLRREALAKKLLEADTCGFWKKVRSINSSHSPLPTCVDGVSGEAPIADLWKSHFQSLFNCLGNTSVLVPNCNVPDDLNVRVSPAEIQSACVALKPNKACGEDGIYAEHLKYASPRLHSLLASCFTGFFVHGFLPDSMISVLLAPVVKDKAGKITSKDNYRPIALASIVSKALERILLTRLEEFLTTQDNQFGFKKSHGTDQCIFVLKELVESYRVAGGSVFLCFLDASKAFDRVDHSILFDKLHKRNVPGYITRILAYWYAKQTMRVRWGNVLSAEFNVTNGVRQGGILSPYLFNVYVDDLSQALNSHKIGCYINNKLVNHIMYADDLCVLAPSAAGLSKLLRVCEDFGTSHKVKYNSSKSAILLCRSDLLKGVQMPVFSLAGEQLHEVSKIKYLGHFLSNDLSDDADIERQCRLLFAQGNMLLRKFHMCSWEVKTHLFRTYCSPMYTAQLWCRYKKATMQKLQTTYHSVLKRLLGLSKYESTSVLFATVDLRTCEGVLRNLTYRFKCRTETTSNCIVQKTTSSSMGFNSKLRRHWMVLLNTAIT